MISVLILTRDEQANLPACLASVAFSDDIHVLDSFSVDNTPTIAREHNAQVTQRKFDDWSTHQNWAVKNIPFKHQWVLYLDADERVTPELRDALLQAAANPTSNVAFRVRRRDFFQGTWLKHVQASPFYIRLFRPEHIRYERLVNPVTIVDGPTGQLPGFLDHFPFSKGVTNWLERHNSYSTFEARQIIENRRGQAPFSIAAAFREPDFNRRRYHQKELFYRLPARPIAKFLLLYFIRGGILDGHAGLTYSILQSIYEYMIVLKTRELESAKK